MARQLTFDLALDPALGRDDFLVTPANALALAVLDAPATWPQGRMLLTGPEGSGKTHLAAIWACDMGAASVPARALRLDTVDQLAREGGALVIEDADRAAGHPGCEQALFHLWNLSAERNFLLLLTAKHAPGRWGVQLPDLVSRMGAVAMTRIEPPDEALLAAVLVKLLADRQLGAPPGLIEWLVPRMDRDLGLARRLIAALDARSMAERRGLTRPLVTELLESLTGTGAVLQ